MHVHVCICTHTQCTHAGWLCGWSQFRFWTLTFPVFHTVTRECQYLGAHGLGGAPRWGCPPLHLCGLYQLIPGHVAMFWFCLSQREGWLPPVCLLFEELLLMCSVCVFKCFSVLFCFCSLLLVHFQPSAAVRAQRKLPVGCRGWDQTVTGEVHLASPA